VGDNQWTKPKNLGGQINKGVSRFPRYSPDGKVIFYANSTGIYWIDASFINDDIN